MPRLASLRIATFAALLLAATGGWVLYGRSLVPAHYTRNPLGEPLPDVVVESPDGTPVRLKARLGGRPALIYVFSAAQCASCSNLSLEFRILHGAYPALQTLLVGSGASRETFRDAFRAMELTDVALVDEPRALLHALSLTREPVVLLADSTGRIVFVDQRSPSQAAQYPIGRVLADLEGALGTRRAGGAK